MNDLMLRPESAEYDSKHVADACLACTALPLPCDWDFCDGCAAAIIVVFAALPVAKQFVHEALFCRASLLLQRVRVLLGFEPAWGLPCSFDQRSVCLLSHTQSEHRAANELLDTLHRAFPDNHLVSLNRAAGLALLGVVDRMPTSGGVPHFNQRAVRVCRLEKRSLAVVGRASACDHTAAVVCAWVLKQLRSAQATGQS